MLHLGQLRIRQLQLLAWLADGVTLSLAAQRLHVSGSAVTLMLRELETRVGSRLFLRDRRGARATPEGERLAARARVLLQEFGLFENELGGSNSVGLSFRLGVIPQVMVQSVPALGRLYARHGFGTLSIHEGTSTALIGKVVSGELGAAIARVGLGTAAQPGYSELQLDMLGFEQAAVAVPTTHPLARKRKVGAQDLAALDWVLPPPDSYIRKLLELYFQQNKAGAPRALMQVDSTVQALWCASQLGCAAAGPLSLIRHRAREWKLKVLPIEIGMPIQLGLLYRASQNQLPQFQALRSHVIHQAPDLQKPSAL